MAEVKADYENDTLIITVNKGEALGMVDSLALNGYDDLAEEIAEKADLIGEL